MGTGEICKGIDLFSLISWITSDSGASFSLDVYSELIDMYDNLYGMLTNRSHTVQPYI